MYTTSTAGPTVGIPKATIDFGDGNTIDAGTGGAGTAINGALSHSYASAGNFTITFQAITSDRGTGKASVSVSVTPKPPPPGLQLRPDPTTPQVGQTVTFSFTASGLPDGAQIQLNYGDGAGEQLSGSSGTVSHAYSAANSYAVVLSAVDAGGRILGAASTVLVVGG